MVAFEIQIDLAALGDQQRVLQGARNVAEQFLHLHRAAKVEGAVGHPHPIRFAADIARLDAKHNVLQVGIFRVDIVDVVGGHKACLVAGRQLQELLVHLVEFGDAMGLEFDEETIGAENLVVPIEALGAPSRVPLLQGAGHVGGQAASGADQPLAVRGQKIAVDAGFVVEPLQLRCGGNLQ